MITSRDINTRCFEQAKPGYKPEEVDLFLKEIAAQIDAEAQSRADAEKKIEVLVESVRKYKSDEDALKEALIGAQKQAKTVIADAQEKAQQIITEAQQKAEQIISAANVKSDEIIGSVTVRADKARTDLENMKIEVSNFKASILNMYRDHLELIKRVPDVEIDEDDERTAQPVQQAVSEDSEADAAADMEKTMVLDSSTIIFDSPEEAMSHLSHNK